MAYNKRILSEIDRELKDRYRSKRYSKSLAATNSLFAVNDLFAKPSRRRIYNPNAQYFQGGGALKAIKAISKNSKKILKPKELNVIKKAAKDFKQFATRSSDVTVPAIKKAQIRLLEAADPKSRTIMSGVELTPDGRLKVSSDKKIRGGLDRSFSVLKRDDEERLQAFTEHLKEEADLLKSNAESYLENPYAIDLNRGDSLQFDKDGFLIEPLGGFYHGIGSTSPGFSLENLEFDRSKIDPETMKGWTSTGNKAGNSKAEYGFFGALNKNQGSQAALKYDGTRERAVMDMLRDPSKRPGNLGTIKEIGLSPNARLVGGKSPYVLNALRDVGINVTEMAAGPHIGGHMGMTPQKAAMLKSKYGIDGIIDLGGDELAIFNPDVISSVSDLPFKLFDYTNPLIQSIRQSGHTARDMENILQNQFGSSYINSNYNQPYIPSDHSWAVSGADKLGSMMDNTNAYEAREILQGPGSYFRGGLRIGPYALPDRFPAGLPFSEKWWKAAEPNLDLIRQKGGPINTSGPRAEGTSVDEDAMNAMMKARLAYEEMHGNPAAKRMVAPVDNPYDFGDGRTGTHYMSSYDNYAIPEIQDVDGTLEMTGPRDNEAMRFDREEDARYFANENYKRVSPMFINAELDDEEIQKYVDGGYIVEEMAEGGDVDVKCPPGKAWNGKYCAKIQIVTEDGKKIKVVPSAYEMDNPTDPNNPYGIELQRLSDIDQLYEHQDEYGWDDEMTNKKICGDAGCHSVLIDDDTEIEDIVPVKKRRTIEEIYPEVDHDKYPTIDDFDFAAKYYDDKGENPPDDLLPSNRVVEVEPEEEPKIEELDVEPLPVIEPEPIINVTPDPIIDGRVRENEIVEEEEDIEDESPSPEDWDVTEVWDNEGDAVILPYEETTGKYKKERRGARRPPKKNRSWDGIKGNLQRIFTDKEYSGPWFPGLKRRIKQEGGVPEFQGGGIAKAVSKAASKTKSKLVGTANDIKGDMLLHAMAPLQYLTNLRPNRSSLVPRFGLTKSLKDKFQLEQDLAAKDASNFVNDWYYKPDKIIRPEVAGRIRDLYKEELSPEQFHQRKSFKTRLDNGEVGKWGVDKFVDGEQVITNPDLLESMLTLDQSARYLDHPDNVLTNKPNLLVGRNSNDILGNSNLNDGQKAYLLKKRFGIAGVNFHDDGPSVTLNKAGSFYINPDEIAETVVHEGGHTSQHVGNWINQVQEWDPKKSTYYRAKDKGPGEHFKKVLWPNSGENPLLKPFAGLTDYYGSVNELHSQLMRGRFKVANKMAEAQMKKDGFTSKKYDDFQLRGLRRDYRSKAIEDLQNPSDQQIKQLIKAGTLNFHFKPGAKKKDKYKAIRMLPGVGAAFALPSLMDNDDKPKLQKGGGVNRPTIEYKSNDEIQEDIFGPSQEYGGYFDILSNNIVIPFSASQNTLDHENMHAVQKNLGRLRQDPMTPKQKPSMLSSDEVVGNYYNRHQSDIEHYDENYADIVNPSSEKNQLYERLYPFIHDNNYMAENPEFTTLFNKYWPKDMDLMSPQIKYAKGIEPALYADPTTMEGEAEYAASLLGARRNNYTEKHPEGQHNFPIDMYDAIEKDGFGSTLDYIFRGQKQMGGALELGDEVTQDMVEELRRQGYTIEEI